MSNEVLFEDDSKNNLVRNVRVPGVPTGMLGWLVKEQIAKNTKQAEQFLLGTIMVAVIAAVLIWWLGGTSHVSNPSPTQIQSANHTMIPLLR